MKQMSATERSVLRSSAAARSSLRVSRYWCGVSPNSRRNSRLKWAGESRAAFAAAATSSGSKYRASIRSFARSRWRAGATGFTAGLQADDGDEQLLRLAVDVGEHLD